VEPATLLPALGGPQVSAIPTQNPLTSDFLLVRASCVMTESNNAAPTDVGELSYVQYETGKEEEYLPSIRQLIGKDLSEPYSIYVYRYFLYQWGDLCFMVSLVECTEDIC
jgi:hypothetical protein